MNEDIWNILFPSSDINILVFMLFVFFLSGIVKGFLGIGLPAAAMALLTLVIPPAQAISLLVIPILFTNLTQFSRAKYRLESIKTYWLFAIAIILSIFFNVTFSIEIPNWTTHNLDWLGNGNCILKWPDRYKIENKRKENLAGWFWGFIWCSRRLKFNLVTNGRNLSNCKECG